MRKYLSNSPMQTFNSSPVMPSLPTSAPILAAMGFGMLNEMIEFSAVLMVPGANVGGYYNTALDLVSNSIGAVIAIIAVAWSERGGA